MAPVLFAALIYATAIGAASSAPSVPEPRLGPALSLDEPQRLLRAQQLAEEDSAQSLVQLWLLAHDAHEEVVAAALHSALSRCPRESADVCQAMLRFFVPEDDSPGAWRVRTQLLLDAPQVAVQRANKHTKLEVVALLAGKLSQSSAPQGLYKALRLLAEDEESDVQEAASAVLLGIER